MSARTPGRRAATLWAALGAVILAGGCASQPSQGPNTQTGLPTHVDGGARQVLRFCETLHDNGELATICKRPMAEQNTALSFRDRLFDGSHVVHRYIMDPSAIVFSTVRGLAIGQSGDWSHG